MKLSELKPLEKNPFKSKGDKQIEAIGKSISEFERMMEIRKIVVDENWQILGGNKRYFALKALGRTEIPDSWVDKVVGLTEDQKREFIVKDNSHWGSEWDFELLKDWGVDVDDWGVQVDWEEPQPEASEDDYQIPDEIVTDIVVGDLFEIGVHRLLCGDSTDKETVERLMGGEKADISIQSPPYNVGRTPNGNEKKYQNNNDNKSNDDYLYLLNNSTKNAITNSIFSFINIQSVSGNKTSIIDFLSHLKNWFCDYIIWDKLQSEPAMGENILNSRFEFVYVFGESAKRRIGLKKFRGNLENIIFIKSRQDKSFSEIHKATFPVAFASYFIENFSVQSCLDLFCGTGTTMVAAHQLNRRCYGLELEPEYCQVIIDRMRKLDPTIEIKKNGEPMKFTAQ